MLFSSTSLVSKATSAFRRFGKTGRFGAIVAAAATVYGLVWSLISITKLNTYHATVFDLGVSSYLMWSVFHGHFALVPEKAIYLLIAPFYYLYPAQAALLVLQSFWIGLGSVPVYLMAKRIIGQKGAVIASLGYLLYFPLAGIDWFDFHFMALFPTLFFTALYFRMAGKRIPSALFFVLSCTTDALAPVIVATAGCILTIDDHRIEHGKSPMFPRDNERISMRYDAAVAIFPVLFLSGIVALFGAGTLLKYIPFQLSLSSAVSAFSFDLLWKLLFLLIPVLPLSLFARKNPIFLLLSVPYDIFALFSTDINNFTPYYYQYAALYAPGLVLAALLSLGKMKDLQIFFSHSRKKFIVKPATLFITFIVVSGAFLLPYSPANAYMPAPPGGNYLFLHNVLPNSVDEELTKMIALIPPNASVLMQNNMPQLTQRANFTIPGVYKGGYLPGYIVTDPHSRFFYVNINGSTKGDMLYWVNRLFATGQYGVMAEAGNCIMLAKGYSGPMKYFVPYAAYQPLAKTQGSYQGFQTYLADGVYEFNLASAHSGNVLFHMNFELLITSRSGTIELNSSTYASITVESGSIYSLLSITISQSEVYVPYVISITQSGEQRAPPS